MKLTFGFRTPLGLTNVALDDVRPNQLSSAITAIANRFADMQELEDARTQLRALKQSLGWNGDVTERAYPDGNPYLFVSKNGTGDTSAEVGAKLADLGIDV
jgi:hypothetical protein